MTKSTTIIAFDQHAATTVAAVLLPGTSDAGAAYAHVGYLRRSCASSSDSPRSGPCACCYEAGPVRLRAPARADAPRPPLRRHRPGADSAPRLAIASKPTDAMPRSSPCSIVPARSRPFTFRPSRKRPPAICCAVAKISAPISFAPAIVSRNSCCATVAASPPPRRRGRNATTSGSRAQTLAVAGARADPSGLSSAPSMKPSRVCRRSSSNCATLLDPRAAARPRASACAASAASTISPPSPSPPNSATPAASRPRRASWPSSASCRPSTPAAPNRPAARSPKPGNAHLRRVLVESAWHYRHHPFLGDALAPRDSAARPTPSSPMPGTAQQRLHRRYRRLAARGKPKQHIVTAIARELTGFLWAALTQ